MRGGHHLDVLDADVPAGSWVAEPRIKVAVLAATALGYVFGTAGLAAVQVPVQLWEAGEDHVLSGKSNAEALLRDLPHRPEFHLVNGADHADFSQPCSAAIKKAAAALCESKLPFDRSQFHVSFNAEIVSFFCAKLGCRQGLAPGLIFP